ncbi:protein of unknown function [Burkholderia multivorans]
MMTLFLTRNKHELSQNRASGFYEQ